MKLSDALAAGMDIADLQTAVAEIARCGGPADPGNRAALVAWLRANPRRDVKVNPVALPIGRKTLRPEQDKFRRAVFRAYGGKCALTGESCEAVLEAAHIRDKTFHNNARDGILLRADLHKLLDAKPPLLRLVREGNEIVARVRPEAGTDYARLNGQKIRQPRRISDRPAL